MYLSGLHSLPKQKDYELLANLWYRYVSANITSLKIIVTLTVHQAFWYRRKQEIKNKKIQIQEKQEKKNSSFSWRISLVNVSKSAVFSRFACI